MFSRISDTKKTKKWICFITILLLTISSLSAKDFSLKLTCDNTSGNYNNFYIVLSFKENTFYIEINTSSGCQKLTLKDITEEQVNDLSEGLVEELVNCGDSIISEDDFTLYAFSDAVLITCITSALQIELPNDNIIASYKEYLEAKKEAEGLYFNQNNH